MRTFPANPYSTEIAFQALRASNVFPSHEEKDKVARMAALASLMYSGIEDLNRVDALFPYPLVLMPTPEKLGIKLPTGLKVQAFRHHDEVIIAIRGTELNKDSATKISNLIADLGIGRHKSNDDLIDSVKKVNARVYSSYGFEINEKTIQSFETLINSRVLGHTDTTRALEVSKRVGSSVIKGGAQGGFVGGVIGGALATVGVAGGLAAPPIGAVFALCSLGVGSLLGGGTSGASEVLACATVMDGYPTLLSYIKAIDAYIMKLKGADGSKVYIQNSDSVIFLGHSLAGYLAAAGGASHGDEIYAFNGPGLDFEEEIKQIINNLGLERKVQRTVSYHSVSMETDFIGNLGKREGSLRQLFLPIPFTDGDFPPSEYISPLSHHGIDLMGNILNFSSVLHLPKNRFSNSTNEDHPRIEEID